MSKLIVEMEMPKNCKECEFSTGCSFCEGYDDHCVLAPRDAEYEWNFSDGIEPSERPSWCPIKGVLPDEHGDLVDADTVLWEVPDSEGIIPPMPVTIGDVIEGYDVPIVIAAERKDDE